MPLEASAVNKRGELRLTLSSSSCWRVFPLAFVALFLEEPLDCMASHNFEGAEADRGELWFSKGVALCVTAMVDADADHGGVHSEADTSSAPAEWGWAEIAEPGERAWRVRPRAIDPP